ncbi:hypothetical protein BGZ60DRAFT_395218 [Tricladium varicosporioides]|nr:hypothetical protein BGZ60DRAFT_395218 [Hymenoscyphus varicosporioides]
MVQWWVGRAPASRSSLPLLQQHTIVERPRVQPVDLCTGCIVWLPKKEPDRDEIYCNCGWCEYPFELNEDGYNHPVVVLRIKQRKGSSIPGDVLCDVACITTFSDTPLSIFLQSRNRRNRKATPIFHPDFTANEEGEAYTVQLYLENDRKLHKQSYVRLSHVYQVPACFLQSLSFQSRKSAAYLTRLDYESYAILMNQLRLPRDVALGTREVAENGRSRLMELASMEIGLEVEVEEDSFVSSLLAWVAKWFIGFAFGSIVLWVLLGE